MRCARLKDTEEIARIVAVYQLVDADGILRLVESDRQPALMRPSAERGRPVPLRGVTDALDQVVLLGPLGRRNPLERCARAVVAGGSGGGGQDGGRRLVPPL